MKKSGRNQEAGTKIVKPKTKAGKRALERKAPKLKEDPKKALVFSGHRTSQTVKDILVDLQKLKANESIKLTNKKHDILPFEAGGEVELERYSDKCDASLFLIGSHSRKRPNNLVMGRTYDHKLYDMIEFGVLDFKPLRGYAASSIPQLGNKPAFVFVGQAFSTDPACIQSKSILLDFFRGREIEQVNLKGLDRVIFVSHTPPTPGGSDSNSSPLILFRQYAVKYKKSGTQVPKVQLQEMGPRLDLSVRRRKTPPVDLEKEAMKQPKIIGKKVKNVGADTLDGKVGKIYIPRQDLDSIALNKMKGAKREKRDQAAERKSAKKMKRPGIAENAGE